MLIRNIWAVGRNYADHIAEMKADTPKAPVIFLKAGSSATVNSNEIELPHWAEVVHHEIELAFKLNNQLDMYEMALALDLTERKLQAEAKKSGMPWTLSKSFDGACPVSTFLPFRKWEEIEHFSLALWVNGELKQQGALSSMLIKPAELCQYIQEHFPVCAGDLILTGTPAGVGPLVRGDKVKVQLINDKSKSPELTHLWVVK